MQGRNSKPAKATWDSVSKKSSVVNLFKMGKVCVPLSPQYVNELKKDINPIPLHHLQHSCKRTDDRYSTKVSTTSCMLSRGHSSGVTDIRLCTVQSEHDKKQPRIPTAWQNGVRVLIYRRLKIWNDVGQEEVTESSRACAICWIWEPQIQKSWYMYPQTYIYTLPHKI